MSIRDIPDNTLPHALGLLNNREIVAFLPANTQQESRTKIVSIPDYTLLFTLGFLDDKDRFAFLLANKSFSHSETTRNAILKRKRLDQIIIETRVEAFLFETYLGHCNNIKCPFQHKTKRDT